MDENVFRAILSIDAHNRGHGAELRLSPPLAA
jgi:hypothetical protein